MKFIDVRVWSWAFETCVRLDHDCFSEGFEDMLRFFPEKVGGIDKEKTDKIKKIYLKHLESYLKLKNILFRLLLEVEIENRFRR